MDLIERCKSGDASAQRELVETRTRQVYRWAVLLGVRPREAEDVAQEVLVTALRRIARCRSQAVATSWLYQITRRIVANQRRLAWFRRVLLTQEPERAAFGHVNARGMEEELDLRRFLDRLPRKLVEVLMLMEVEGFTRDEVAEMLQLPAGTVASRLRLAREAFRAAAEHAPAREARQKLSWRAR